jgi:hypothetical protein
VYTFNQHKLLFAATKSASIGDEPNYADQVMRQRPNNTGDKRVIELELPDVICAAVLYETSKCRQAIEQITRVHVDVCTHGCADPNLRLVRLTVGC